MVKAYAEKQKRHLLLRKLILKILIKHVSDHIDTKRAQSRVKLRQTQSRFQFVFCIFQFKTPVILCINIKPSHLVSPKQGLDANPKQTSTVSMFPHTTTISANAYCLNANHRKWYQVHTQLQGAPLTMSGVPQQPTISFQMKNYTFFSKNEKTNTI